jgi:hypothetical protein
MQRQLPGIDLRKVILTDEVKEYGAECENDTDDGERCDPMRDDNA